MKNLGIIVLIAMSIICALAIASNSSADCRCLCVDNEETWVCSNSWDVEHGYCGGWCSE